MNEAQTFDDVNENLQDEASKIDTPTSDDIDNEVVTEEADTDSSVDFAKIVVEDIKALKEEFSELSELSDICELDNPLRYAALRDLGLSPAEAYLASSKRHKKDNRSHLVATRSVSVSQSGSMSDAELSMAREIFGGISDTEIRKLYKKVTK